jgi:predicted nuclease of predicted toxin-antitoxin system
LAEWPRKQGHDVEDAAELGADPGDAALLELCVARQRILVTIDADFGALIYRDAAAHAGIVRLPSVPSLQRIALMDLVLSRHESDLVAKAIVTVRGGRIRISH